MSEPTTLRFPTARSLRRDRSMQRRRIPLLALAAVVWVVGVAGYVTATRHYHELVFITYPLIIAVSLFQPPTVVTGAGIQLPWFRRRRALVPWTDIETVYRTGPIDSQPAILLTSGRVIQLTVPAEAAAPIAELGGKPLRVRPLVSPVAPPRATVVDAERRLAERVRTLDAERALLRAQLNRVP